MIPERVPDVEEGDALCKMAERWTIHPELAMRLGMMARYLPYPITIISGWRSASEQVALDKAGRPAAPDHLSTHRSCPATGADIWTPTVTPVTSVRAAVGEAAIRAGLRWGGGSKVDPTTGIPSDWNHVDLGPRS